MVLVPPVLLKVASTGWRFARYYRGAPAYRRKGPPPLLLRLLGPAVVILTVVLLASGVGLLLVAPSWLPLLINVHKASFVLWFGAMTIHVLGHLGEVYRLAPRDWLRRTRETSPSGSAQWLIAASLVAGMHARFLLLSHVGLWLAVRPGGNGTHTGSGVVGTIRTESRIAPAARLPQFTFCFAGLQKLTNPQFFDTADPTSIQSKLTKTHATHPHTDCAAPPISQSRSRPHRVRNCVA